MDALAIQAIQQAADPSAVATAFANGIALDRSDAKLYAEYLARMVDFGRPELAYRQAQALTILQPGNGLALGVVAYLDARRGRMADAITDINLAGQFAPGNRFVAHTAGELLAWYDLKADQTTLTEKANHGVARIRALLAKQVAFAGAYDTACKAYRAHARTELPPAQAASGQYARALQTPPAPPVPAPLLGPRAPQLALQGDLVAPWATRRLCPHRLTIPAISIRTTRGLPISVTIGAQRSGPPACLPIPVRVGLVEFITISAI